MVWRLRHQAPELSGDRVCHPVPAKRTHACRNSPPALKGRESWLCPFRTPAYSIYTAVKVARRPFLTHESLSAILPLTATPWYANKAIQRLGGEGVGLGARRPCEGRGANEHPLPLYPLPLKKRSVAFFSTMRKWLRMAPIGSYSVGTTDATEKLESSRGLRVFAEQILPCPLIIQSVASFFIRRYKRKKFKKCFKASVYKGFQRFDVYHQLW